MKRMVTTSAIAFIFFVFCGGIILIALDLIHCLDTGGCHYGVMSGQIFAVIMLASAAGAILFIGREIINNDDEDIEYDD